MVDVEAARDLCLSFPSVEEYDHFGKPAYRVGKKIFVTLGLDHKRAVVKLTQSQQPELCEEFHPAVFPIKNKWGQLGWTNVELEKISKVAFQKLVQQAWMNVAPKKLIKEHDM